MSSLHPSQREDVMGKYSFMNRYQCERLCWYRKLCKTYTYIYNRTLATGGNCVLHAENISTNTTSGVSTDWVEREAFWDEALQDNGCRNRTCNDTQVCVPTFASPFYACLPLPADSNSNADQKRIRKKERGIYVDISFGDKYRIVIFTTVFDKSKTQSEMSVKKCQAPPRDDGVYSNVTLLQGQRTNFTCNPSLVWAPRHADKTVTCQVNGKYSELKGTCKNATYYSPSVPFNKPLPDVKVLHNEEKARDEYEKVRDVEEKVRDEYEKVRDENEKVRDNDEKVRDDEWKKIRDELEKVRDEYVKVGDDDETVRDVYEKVRDEYEKVRDDNEKIRLFMEENICDDKEGR
ncbi:hypothetical protein C0Q70_13323 [Pomacea canaliculata]|uniref:Sushi domain-containing protein n=1 Tax=Pomacea canaliculata TaxID=400727 RepID=A0A2T7NWW8_POMCA|nr:hypothetical protein C0Q70_13323 [Pomacea canaliculata]